MLTDTPDNLYDEPFNQINKEAETFAVTCKSIIGSIASKGYVVLDRAGSEQMIQYLYTRGNVKNRTESPGEKVMSRLSDIHIRETIRNKHHAKLTFPVYIV